MNDVYLVEKKGKQKKLRAIGRKEISENHWEGPSGQKIDSQYELISMLLPPAVKAFFSELEGEVVQLCGKRYSHTNESMTRWGNQPGSIFLGNQRVSVQRPRVRDTVTGEEVIPASYTRFQDPGVFDQRVFHEGLKHVSQRDHEKGLPKIAASFGVSKSSISRSWIRTTKKQVEKILDRNLGPLDVVAVFIDGKRFASLGVVVALGIAENGSKYVLGIYQSSTENSAACLALLTDLERRGLPESNLLFVVDGGSGLNKALNEKYQIDDPENRRAYRVRCWVHKWRNIYDVLDEKGRAEAKPLYWAVRDAKDMAMAKNCSDSLEACLKHHNPSALRSYLEAKDDLLAIHRLQISSRLKTFFSTTNPIESLNSLLEEDMRRVKRWRNPEHFQRWLATACLQNEKRLRKIRGYRGLAALVIRIKELCTVKENIDNAGTAA